MPSALHGVSLIAKVSLFECTVDLVHGGALDNVSDFVLELFVELLFTLLRVHCKDNLAIREARYSDILHFLNLTIVVGSHVFPCLIGWLVS